MNENTLFSEQPITTIIELLPHTQSKDLEHYMLEELKQNLINKYDPDYGIINKIKNIIRYTEGELINDNYGKIIYNVTCTVNACNPKPGDQFIGIVKYITKTFINVYVGNYINIIIMIDHNMFDYVLSYDKDGTLKFTKDGKESIIGKDSKLLVKALKINQLIDKNDTKVNIYGIIDKVLT